MKSRLLAKLVLMSRRRSVRAFLRLSRLDTAWLGGGLGEGREKILELPAAARAAG